MKSQMITTVAKEELEQINLTTTGHTQTVNGKQQYYVVCTMFEELNELHKSSLRKWRNKVTKQHPYKEHPLYFIYKDDKYWYTDKILDYRCYNKERSQELTTRSIPTKSKRKSKTLRETLVDWVYTVPWTLKCAANYSEHVSKDKARIKMEKLFEMIKKRYRSRKVSMFYTIEQNETRDGYHNHFVIAIDNSEKHLKRTITQLIRYIGCDVPHCENYDQEKGQEYLRYSTKAENVTGIDWDYLGESPDTYPKIDKEARKLQQKKMDELMQKVQKDVAAMFEKYRERQNNTIKPNPLQEPIWLFDELEKLETKE